VVADAREVVVVQLQLLDLMILRECGVAPMDAVTRADLIDLMARVLVAVFREEGRRDTGFALGTLWAVGTDDPELAEHEFDRQSRQSGWH
jgi:hypothetical protein